MIVAVSGQHVEDGAAKGFKHLGVISGDVTGHAEKGRVIKISAHHLAHSCQAVIMYALRADTVEASDREMQARTIVVIGSQKPGIRESNTRGATHERVRVFHFSMRVISGRVEFHEPGSRVRLRRPRRK